MTVRRIRRSQTVSPFGVGAIIDVVGESFVAEDAGQWRGSEDIRMPRLTEFLGISGIARPPADREVPYYRFPQWLFCPSCRRMERWSTRREKKNTVPACQFCPRRHLVPMRFVAVCSNGHLTDVHWQRWAHSGEGTARDSACTNSPLVFETSSGVGGGLRSTLVRCVGCNAARSLQDLPTSDGLRRIGQSCSGRQPWQTDSDSVRCERPLRAVQRGASNVYFPRVFSAIDIPPESDWATRSDPLYLLREQSNFQLLTEKPDHHHREVLLDVLAENTGIEVDVIRESLRRATKGDDLLDVARTEHDISRGEWDALTGPPAVVDPLDDFQAVLTRFESAGVGKGNARVARQLEYCITEVTRVERLREVRVLRGFQRLDMAQEVRANLCSRTGVHPGTEVFGEGVFLRFNEQAVAAWECRPDVVARAARLARRRDAQPGYSWLPQPMPRYVLLHTFAHLLLRQTAFEAGYSTSSIRERLYVTDADQGPQMAGIMIYTAAGDAEGTLGGLVRLGELEPLARLVTGALTGARWCSFDPVCGESSGQGPQGLSLAACHACALVPETSCGASNRLLDRSLLVHEEFGFFRDVVAEVEGADGAALP